ncbi:YdcF family protein [Phormidesmis priestleyi ULC007]|uniref:YdcF family protein n=1 Tax=Phormidesmis priestleyi ULC007 TaxID=1920490 RepID=A0A2T1DD07_9CYAN|nr:YdcF family protein [Phormidesmis priestleyi]PSB18333.1 YdcF family protein [Phormidesmis priestleyi ULC007]PZO46587.1 MAG: YdcF family protein [Phormidesmis priestleyi]
MVLLVTDVFVLLTQVLLWIVVGLFTWYVLLKALPRAFLGGLVILLLLGVAAITFYRGGPAEGLFGDIWQVLAIPFSPLGLILIFLLIVLPGIFRGTVSKTGLILLRIAIPLLLILSIPAVSYFLGQRAEAQALQITRAAPAEAIGGRRVIVLLGQGTTRLQLRPRTQPAPAPTPNQNAQAPLIQPPQPLTENAYNILTQQPTQLTEQGNRLIYAARLYQEEVTRGNNPLLVVSAGSREERDRKQGETREGTAESRDIVRFLQSQGVPLGGILEDNNSPTMHDSAFNVRALLRSRQVNFGNQLFLVTSAIEMSRAALTFNREFNNQGSETVVTIVSRPTDFHTLPQRDSLRRRTQGRDLTERSFRLGDLLPNTQAFVLSSRVINEYIASIYYFLRGWIRPVSTI